MSLNEVEKNVGSYGNEDQPARYAALLKSATGKTWYYNFAHRDGGTNGQGNLLLTTFQIESDDDYELSYSRSVARDRDHRQRHPGERLLDAPRRRFEHAPRGADEGS